LLSLPRCLPKDYSARFFFGISSFRWIIQVDYGTGPMVRDEKNGKYRRTRLFVMTLA
jgi:hypothetical protein